MLDASGEPKPGFIYGNNYWLGSRSQCIDSNNEMPFVLVQELLHNLTMYRNPEDEFPPFKLNYFVAHFRHNSTLQYHVNLPNEASLSIGVTQKTITKSRWIEIPILVPHRFHKVLSSREYVAWFWLPHRRSFVDISNFFKFDVTLKKLKNSNSFKI